MKLSTILSKVDPSKIEFDQWDNPVNTLKEQFALWDWIDSDKDYGFREFWLARHLCTDTHVGVKAYYWNNKLICISHQAARKSDENFEWVSKEVYQEVGQYIRSLVEDDETFEVDLLNLEEELPDYYHIEYAGQFIDEKVLYNGKAYTIKQQPRSLNGEINFNSVVVVGEDNLPLTVDCRDLKTPWRGNIND